ncbi:unnamed protein product, partial [Prorocentrum cordatum]
MAGPPAGLAGPPRVRELRGLAASRVQPGDFPLAAWRPDAAAGSSAACAPAPDERHALPCVGGVRAPCPVQAGPAVPAARYAVADWSWQGAAAGPAWRPLARAAPRQLCAGPCASQVQWPAVPGQPGKAFLVPCSQQRGGLPKFAAVAATALAERPPVLGDAAVSSPRVPPPPPLGPRGRWLWAPVAGGAPQDRTASPSRASSRSPQACWVQEPAAQGWCGASSATNSYAPSQAAPPHRWRVSSRDVSVDLSQMGSDAYQPSAGSRSSTRHRSPQDSPTAFDGRPARSGLRSCSPGRGPTAPQARVLGRGRAAVQRPADWLGPPPHGQQARDTYLEAVRMSSSSPLRCSADAQASTPCSVGSPRRWLARSAMPSRSSSGSPGAAPAGTPQRQRVALSTAESPAGAGDELARARFLDAPPGAADSQQRWRPVDAMPGSSSPACPTAGASSWPTCSCGSPRRAP